jgi:hypothetical protein
MGHDREPSLARRPARQRSGLNGRRRPAFSHATRCHDEEHRAGELAKPPTTIAGRKNGEPDHGARISAAARTAVATVMSQYTASASPER